MGSSSTFAYDAQNRLTSAIIGGNTTSLVYDGSGRLIEQASTGSPTVEFLHDGDALVAEYDGAGALLRRYVHGGGVDDPIVWYEGASTSDRRFLHADERGSIIALTDDAGVTLETNIYDDWGIPGETNLGRFQYTGQLWIAELGLYYYKARFYSASLGRFMQTDPIGYEDGMNMYAYVGNDPVNGTDPSGLFACEVPENCVHTETPQEDGSVLVTRTEVNTTEISVGGATINIPTSITPRGSIVLLPQWQSANGAPAVVTPGMKEALLNFSEEEGQPVSVTSGIRTPAQNRIVRGASRSAHLSTNNDQAADIKIDGYSRAQTAAAAFNSGEFERVNDYGDRRGVHVDQRDVGPGTQFYYDWNKRSGPR